MYLLFCITVVVAFLLLAWVNGQSFLVHWASNLQFGWMYRHFSPNLHEGNILKSTKPPSINSCMYRHFSPNLNRRNILKSSVWSSTRWHLINKCFKLKHLRGLRSKQWYTYQNYLSLHYQPFFNNMYFQFL